jgi:hypothetical protein
MFARMADTVDAVAVRGDLVDYGWGGRNFLELSPELRKHIPTASTLRWDSWSLPQPITGPTGFWRYLSGRRHPSAH